jgi:predicted ATPase
VELAAAQVAALTPDEIDRHLIAGAAARNGQEGRPGAERLMDATLDWSHDLLDDEEQAVFRRLAVFADGWTLDAAEHVCADGPGAVAVAPVLVSLVESSLVLRVDRGGATRFRMLHPVREYAARRLEASGEEHATALRHATYYLSLVGPREEDWRVFTPEHLDLIAVEHANCLAALRFAEQTRLAQVVLGLDTSCSSSGGSADSCGPACGVSRRPCG